MWSWWISPTCFWLPTRLPAALQSWVWQESLRVGDMRGGPGGGGGTVTWNAMSSQPGFRPPRHTLTHTHTSSAKWQMQCTTTRVSSCHNRNFHACVAAFRPKHSRKFGGVFVWHLKEEITSPNDRLFHHASSPLRQAISIYSKCLSPWLYFWVQRMDRENVALLDHASAPTRNIAASCGRRIATCVLWK